MSLQVGELFAQIEVDNKAFDKGLGKAEQSFRKTGKNMETEGKSIGKRIGDNLAAGLASGLKNVGRLMTTFVTLPLAAAAAGIVKVGMEYESAMSSIKSLGVSPGDMKAMDALALEMGAKTKFSALEAAQGINELLKAGLTAEQVLDGGLKGALDLAAAGDIDLAEAAMIASTALNAFKNDNLTTAKAADILAGAANASQADVAGLSLGLSQVAAVASGARMSFNDTAAALALFNLNGLKGSDAGTSFKTMLMNLQPVTDKQKKTFAQLNLLAADGTSLFYDETGKMKSLKDIAGLLQISMSGMTDAQRMMAMETMFGSDAIRAANILYGAGEQGITDMYAAMGKVTAAEVAAEKQNNLKGSIENLTGSLETLSIKMYKTESGPLKGLVDGLTKLVNAFGELPPGVQGTILIVGGLVAAIGPALWLIGTIGSVALPMMGAAFTALLGPVGLAIAIVAGLVAGFAYLWNTSPKFREWARGVAAGLKNFFIVNINLAIDALNLLIKGLNWITNWDVPEVKKLNIVTVNTTVDAQRIAEENDPYGISKGRSHVGSLGVPGNAQGTNFWRGGPTWVGEQGPELVNLPRGAQVLNNRDSMAMMGQTVNHTGTIRVEGVNSKNQLVGVTQIIADQLAQDVRRWPSKTAALPSRA